MTKLYSALALLLITASSSFADGRVTKWKWGCEWVQGLNGNYWSRVDGGCPIHMALGYGSANEMRGKDVPPAAEDDSEEPSDPGDDEGPGDEGPGTDPGNDEGPGDGGGDDGPGCDKPGRDKPGKGGGKGKGGKGKGKGRN